MRIPYNNPYFNRAVMARKVTDMIAENRLLLLSDDGAVLFIREGRCLKPALFPLECSLAGKEEMVFLGMHEGQGLWSALRSGEKHNPLPQEAPGGRFLQLREAFPEIDGPTRALLAYALGMHKWHLLSKYCSCCGSHTRPAENGHVRLCTNPECRQPQYPRISPAVIVLIEHHASDGSAYCLLQKRHSPAGISCSTLAGFVEVGESLEDAVLREMEEEVGITVSNIRYVNSQPWVFSSSLMVGFYAESKQMDFRVDGDEIKDAAWFTPGQLKQQVETGKLSLSKEDSIARFLIENWIAIHHK